MKHDHPTYVRGCSMCEYRAGERNAAAALASEFERAAEHAVGSALLFRVSPNGGTSGPGLNERRAEVAAAEGMTGEELYALLLDVARRAAKEAEREAEGQRARIIDRVRLLAHKSDSLSLFCFIESEAAR